MRVVGEIQKKELAERFSSYLLTLKIANEIREGAGKWLVWVHSEDEIGRAEKECEQFLRIPADARYQVVPKPEIARQILDRPPSPRAPAVDASGPIGGVRELEPVTIGLIGISVIVAVLSQLGQEDTFLRYLSCYPPMVWRGQVWRLVTPIFIHFGILHIVFNMMWLQFLGRMIERVKGSLFLVLLVGSIGCLSNACQAVFVGPAFGGMSGVVYGLFGYIWMKSRYEPFEGLLLDTMSIFLMLGWFLLGMAGMAGPVANWAHGIGLVVGMGFGIAPTAMQSLRKRKR